MIVFYYAGDGRVACLIELIMSLTSKSLGFIHKGKYLTLEVLCEEKLSYRIED